jgi:hypothetical protein
MFDSEVCSWAGMGLTSGATALQANRACGDNKRGTALIVSVFPGAVCLQVISPID